MSNLLIQNARMVNEGREFNGDLRIRDQRIAAIAPHLFPRSDEKVLDIKGRWLFPGVIDAQVHFREPGFEYKGDLSSEPAAAVAGGAAVVAGEVAAAGGRTLCVGREPRPRRQGTRDAAAAAEELLAPAGRIGRAGVDAR